MFKFNNVMAALFFMALVGFSIIYCESATLIPHRTFSGYYVAGMERAGGAELLMLHPIGAAHGVVHGTFTITTVNPIGTQPTTRSFNLYNGTLSENYFGALTFKFQFGPSPSYLSRSRIPMAVSNKDRTLTFAIHPLSDRIRPFGMYLGMRFRRVSKAAYQAQLQDLLRIQAQHHTG